MSGLAGVIDRLDSLPRLGLVQAPSPIQPLQGLAAELGLRGLWLKRDDQLPALHGGSKVRKLDVLLATDLMQKAEAWTAVGAIGSGNLVAIAAAAGQCERPLWAHVFWEPPSAHVIENLSFTASSSARLSYYGSRAHLVLRRPRALFGKRIGRHVVIPSGATGDPGIAGVVRGALELAAQIEAGLLPPPDRVVVPLGSGGMLAGLWIGFALAGLSPTLHGVSVVEHPLATRGRVVQLAQNALGWLRDQGCIDRSPALPPLFIDRKQLGRGYAQPTASGTAAIERLAAHHVPLEAVYSGKAMASLLAGTPARESVLFWVTPRRPDALPAVEDWRARLPKPLARRLDGKAGVTRRRVLIAGAVLSAAGYIRCCTGYPAAPDWQGAMLSDREIGVLRALAEVVLPEPHAGPAFDGVPAAVDAYLVHLPEATRRDVHLLLLAIEQSTPLGLEFSRLTDLAPPDRDAYLRRLNSLGGLMGLMYRAARDLCLLGYYQHPATWPDLSFPGPTISPNATRPNPYAALIAPTGHRPRALS